MSSRDEILNSVRAQQLPRAPLPELQGNWIQYPDRFAQFKSTLEGVGGRCVRVKNIAEAAAHLATVPEMKAAKLTYSAVPGFSSNVDLAAIDDPHALEQIDWAIMPGEFGVAENGAVWVTDRQVKHRAIYFIVQHLALVIAADQIVNNLHEAYARITLGDSSLGASSLGQSSWGAFISGPSKTADIEQSLVIGAHGPRSMTLYCVDAM